MVIGFEINLTRNRFRCRSILTIFYDTAVRLAISGRE
jgi:hypothetical protein